VRQSADRARVRVWLPPVVALAAVLGAWEAIALNYRYAIPPLGAVWSVLVGHPGALLNNAGATLAEALPGLAASYAVALLLALAMNQSEIVTRAVLPLAVALNVSPLIAFAPALAIFIGLNRTPRVVLAALITFFPVLINSLVGLRSADPKALEVFQTLHASRWETLWRLQLPSSLPYLFAAARIAVPLSVVGAAVAEMVAPGPGVGLGYFIQQWSLNTQLDWAWAGIVVLAGFGLLLTGLVVAAENRVLRWRGFR
jgi:NitT/TauT family transport system permease protein